MVRNVFRQTECSHEDSGLNNCEVQEVWSYSIRTLPRVGHENTQCNEVKQTAKTTEASEQVLD